MRNYLSLTVIVRLWGQSARLYTECTCVYVLMVYGHRLHFEIFHLRQFYRLPLSLFFIFYINALLLLRGQGEKKKNAEDDESLSASQQQHHNYSATGWMVCVERWDWFTLMVCTERWHVIGPPRHRCCGITTGTAEQRRVIHRREIRFVCACVWERRRIRPRQDKGQTGWMNRFSWTKEANVYWQIVPRIKLKLQQYVWAYTKRENSKSLIVFSLIVPFLNSLACLTLPTPLVYFSTQLLFSRITQICLYLQHSLYII